jgi:Periplasmic copper-binding protein (NosD)
MIVKRRQSISMSRALALALAVALVSHIAMNCGAAAAATVPWLQGDSLAVGIAAQLAPGDTLLVPQGRHRLTEQLIAGITVRGDGPPGSVVILTFIPSMPMLNFPPGGGVTRVENITFDAEDNQEVQGVHFTRDTISVSGNVFVRGIAVLAEECDGVVSQNTFTDCESAVRTRDSRLWIDRNEIVGSKNGAISMRGSPLRITRNRIIQNVNTGIVIVGKRFVPVIGGEPGMGNEIYGGFNSDVTNNSGKDVNAQYNYWGIQSTEEMNRYGFPANIDAIMDKWDMPKDAGEVDYRNWLDAPPPEGKPVHHSGGGASAATTPKTNMMAIGGGLVVILLVVAVRMRRSRRGAPAE